MEADLIIHALTSDGEKKSFLARSALRSKKRFGGGVLEPTHQAIFTFTESRNEGGLCSLKEAQLVKDFNLIRRSYDTLEFALHIVECAERVSQEGDSGSHYLYNLLGHTLKALEESSQLDLLKIQFYLKFFLQQGVLTSEPWMTVFLRRPISEHKLLCEEVSTSAVELEKTKSALEVKIRQYLQNASL